MSRISKVVLVLAGVAIAAAGCKKKDNAGAGAASGSAEASGAGSAAAAEGAAPAVFAKLDLPGRARALQGGWVLDSMGKLAIGIQGDDVTTYDGKKEVHARLRIEAPCKASFVVKTKLGEEATSYSLVMKDGKAHLGHGHRRREARQGRDRVRWPRRLRPRRRRDLHRVEELRRLALRPGTCGFRQDDGKTVFFAKTMGGEETAAVDGDVIWSRPDARRAAPSRWPTTPPPRPRSTPRTRPTTPASRRSPPAARSATPRPWPA